MNPYDADVDPIIPIGPAPMDPPLDPSNPLDAAFREIRHRHRQSPVLLASIDQQITHWRNSGGRVTEFIDTMRTHFIAQHGPVLGARFLAAICTGMKQGYDHAATRRRRMRKLFLYCRMVGRFTLLYKAATARVDLAPGGGGARAAAEEFKAAVDKRGTKRGRQARGDADRGSRYYTT
jgi:hypothetical protein